MYHACSYRVTSVLNLHLLLDISGYFISVCTYIASCIVI